MSRAGRAVASKSDVYANKRQVARAKILVALRERILLALRAMNSSVLPRRIGANDD